MCPTIFMLYQLGYKLNLEACNMFNVMTHSRQKSFTVYIINEHCKLLHVMQNNYTQRMTHRN